MRERAAAQIEIDRAQAARYGLNVVDVQNVIETALGGKQATEIWEGERKYPVGPAPRRSAPRYFYHQQTRWNSAGLRVPLETGDA